MYQRALAGYEKALGPDHGRTRRLAQTLDEAAKEYSKCQVSNVTDDSLKAALDKSVVRCLRKLLTLSRSIRCMAERAGCPVLLSL
jgi:hypothetical protein